MPRLNTYSFRIPVEIYTDNQYSTPIQLSSSYLDIDVIESSVDKARHILQDQLQTLINEKLFHE